MPPTATFDASGSMSSGIVFHLLAALAYAALGMAAWRPLARNAQPAAPSLPGSRWGLLAAIVLHGIGLHQSILMGPSLYLGWSLALSAAIWLGLIVFWLESLILDIRSLLLILLPAATLATALAGLFPQGAIVAHANDEWLRMHLTIALIAYGLITVAALQAILMTALERQLHRPVLDAAQRGLLNRALDIMPPLLVQERLLFRLILIGFLALTLTVITGAVASIRLKGPVVPFDHKTAFTLLSWITFGGLLLGRRLRGWRGRIALRWTLTGFAFLLLSYTGTRFVLEVLLQRG